MEIIVSSGNRIVVVTKSKKGEVRTTIEDFKDGTLVSVSDSKPRRRIYKQ